MENESAAVHGALYRALRILRVFGVAPLRFTRRHTVTTVRLWKTQLFYGYFLCTILNVMIMLAVAAPILFPREDRLHVDPTKVGLAIFMITLSSTMSIVSAAAYGAHKRMKHLLLQLNQLNKITILKPTDATIAKDRKRTLIATLGMAILLSAVVADLVLSATTGFLDNPTKFEAILSFLLSAQYAQTAIVLMLAVQIMLVITMMHTAVESFNYELRPLLDVITTDGNEAMAFKLQESLQRITRYYLTLCENVRQMNNREGAIMLLLVVYFIAQLVNSSYRVFLAVILTSQLSYTRYLHIAVRLFWASVYVILMGALVHACDRIQEEVQKLRALVSELVYRSREAGRSMTATMAVLCEQLLIHDPTFIPLCICPLTRSLFVTVISGVITYLVSVVKLYTMEESFKNDSTSLLSAIHGANITVAPPIRQDDTIY